MDSSANVDPLNDSAPMPELSFEDLLDDSPMKKSFSAVEDPLEFEDELPLSISDTLNTPGPKKPPLIMKQTSGVATATTATTQNPNTTTIVKESAAKTVVAATNASVKLTTTTTPTTTNLTTPVVLNSRNILPKSATTGAGQLVKISPKIMVTGATSTLVKSPSTATTVSTTSAPGSGKTAIKTASGQILYIQKKAASSSAGAMNTGGGTTTLTIATTPTISNSNKTVAFKLMRTSGGSLVPIQTTNGSQTSTVAATTTTATSVGAKNTLTLSPKVASQLQAAAAAAAVSAGGKRIISAAGGQVVIKTSLPPSVTTTRSTTATATTTALATTTTTYRLSASGAGATNNSSVISTANTNKNALPAGHKIIVQSANGKQILVSNQQLIKLSPKPPTQGATINSISLSTATTTSSTTTASTTAARQLQSIQQVGKQVQYLRVLPKGNADGSATVVSNAAAATVLTSTTAGSVTTQTKSGATSTFKILNAGGIPSKFTVVRPSQTGVSTKLILTQSPKKEGSVPVTFSPITSKVQKTIVTVPKLSALGDGQQRSIGVSNTAASAQSSANLISCTTAQLVNTNASQSLIKNNNSVVSSTGTLIRKHKISEINSELKRITTTTGVAEDDSVDMDAPPEAKKFSTGSRIVMLPRSMLRTTSSGQVRQVTLQSNAGTAVDSNGGTSGSGGGQSPNRKLSIQQQQQHMQSVLKSNNCYVVSADGGGQKSLLINGKAQGAFSQQQQQQQQKTLQLKRQMQQQQQQKYLLQKKQEQLEQQNDTKFHTLQRITNNNSSSSNGSNNNNSASNQNNNVANSVDNKLLNFKIKVEPLEFEEDIKPTPSDLLADAANGGIRRKHCNCSKSQCLKLYCDCFANGEFCQDCTCKDCCNNLENEDQRQRAIKNCLERNPSAFKPKITTSREQGDMRHNKGCNCKRSGCLKNYCECYEAKIPCSSNCKCIGCRNIEERPDLDMDPTDSKVLATLPNAGQPTTGQKRSYDKANSKGAIGGLVNDKFYKDTAKALGMGNDLLAGLAVGGSGSILTGGSSSCSGSGSNGVGAATGVTGTTSAKQQCNFITQDVVEATIQCLISQADQCEKNGLPAYQTEKMVMEEMGRCLVEIIDFSIRNTDTSFTQE